MTLIKPEEEYWAGCSSTIARERKIKYITNWRTKKPNLKIVKTKNLPKQVHNRPVRSPQDNEVRTPAYSEVAVFTASLT